MAWMSDEAYLLNQDTRDKKVTARGARHARTHCGKSGAVKFPSDYLSRKELKAMNGPVETYRMNAPITWEEFKSYPDEHKKTYIQLLRKKFNVPDKYVAEMFGIAANTLTGWFKCLGLAKGAGNGAKTWDKEGFLAWRAGAPEAVKPSETPVEVEVITEDECIDILEEAKVAAEAIVNDVFESSCKTHNAVPESGQMSFRGHIDDILRTVRTILDNANVSLTVSWYVKE